MSENNNSPLKNKHIDQAVATKPKSSLMSLLTISSYWSSVVLFIALMCDRLPLNDNENQSFDLFLLNIVG